MDLRPHVMAFQLEEELAYEFAKLKGSNKAFSKSFIPSTKCLKVLRK